MIIVGEKINSSLKGVAEAVTARNVEFVSQLALRQAEAGADYIDVNCGTLLEDESDALPWLVEIVQKNVDKPCCIDSPNYIALEKALKVHRGKSLINSITAEPARYESIIPLVKQYQTGIIALVIDEEHGMPKDSTTRIEIGMILVNRLMKDGIPLSDIYIDPLIQPISTRSEFALVAIETIKAMKQTFPEIHFMCGLSNISYGLPQRRLLNRTFITLCMLAGLDGAILDPDNKQMMAAITATEALLNQDRHSLKYLKAFRNGLLD